MPEVPRRRELVALLTARSANPLVRALPWLALAALLAALFGTTLIWLVRSWQVHPYYTHGILLIPIAGWFLWRDRADLTVDPPSDLGFALVAAGLLIHLSALSQAFFPVSAAGLLVVLAGLAALSGGLRALRSAAFPIVLLGLAIPLPFVEKLAPPLAGAIARTAVLAAGSVGAGVIQAGAQLTVGDGSFTVGAPCSGLSSVVALASLAVVMAGAAEGPKLSRGALIALAIPVALTASWLRLTGFIWLVGTSGSDGAFSLYHSMSSPILIALCTLALLAIGAVMGCHVRARG
jgi:exosortase